MAGIYIHIPFCKVKCNYCDFHFSTNQTYLGKMTLAICNEINQKVSYNKNEIINTIYFGGGTPSVLPFKNLKLIVDSINKNYTVAKNVEFTFECNPDDLTPVKLKNLKLLGVNRLSIGIQSFNNEQLKFMNRAHNANEAENCVKLAQHYGFKNITIDLIYGLPNTDANYWQLQINKALSLNVNHISAYCLTIESKTVFGNWHKKGKLIPLNDTDSLNQFKLLQKSLKNAGYEHYEISNFAKKGFISKHNSAYWLGEKYIGVGPSAHSYNGYSRQWNVANNMQYIKAIENNTSFFEIEELSKKDIFNEYILTRLRTKWGVNLFDIKQIDNELYNQTIIKLKTFINSGDIVLQNNIIFLSQKGKFIADFISAELFA